MPKRNKITNKSYLIIVVVLLVTGISTFIYIRSGEDQSINNYFITQPRHEQEVTMYSVSGTVIDNDEEKGFVVLAYQAVVTSGITQMLQVPKTIHADKETQIINFSTKTQEITNIQLSDIPINANVVVFTKTNPNSNQEFVATRIEFKN